MSKNNNSIGSISLDLKLNVDCDTVQVCLKLLEAYLNNNEQDTLVINCDEPGNWDLSVHGRQCENVGYEYLEQLR